MSDPYSVLIDTCAMAKLSFFCELCDSVKKEYGTELSALYSSLPKPLTEDSLETKTAKIGYKYYKHLRDLSNNGNILLHFSLFTRIELFDVFLDISTDELLATQGIPFRVRRKKPFRWQVQFDFNKNVVSRYETIIKCLDAMGITISCPEEDTRSSYRLAFMINEILSSHVFLDSFDSYLYSLGLFLMVDEILTDDGEFEKIMEDFSTKPEWETHRETVKTEIIKIDSDYKELCAIEREDGSVLDVDLSKFKFPQMIKLQ